MQLQTTQAKFSDLPEGTGAMAVLGKSGDTKHIWDRTQPAEVEAARALFNSLVTEKRYRAFKVNRDGGQGEMVREFDPNEERYIFVPPMQGG